MAGVGSGVELRLLGLHLLLGEAVLHVRQGMQVHAVGVGAANAPQEEVAVLGGAEARSMDDSLKEGMPNLAAVENAAIACHDAGERLLCGGKGDVSGH